MAAAAGTAVKSAAPAYVVTKLELSELKNAEWKNCNQYFGGKVDLYERGRPDAGLDIDDKKSALVFTAGAVDKWTEIRLHFLPVGVLFHIRFRDEIRITDLKEMIVDSVRVQIA